MRIAINTKNKWTIWKTSWVTLRWYIDVEEKPEIIDELVSFGEVILLELLWMVDFMAADDLSCRLVIDALIVSE